MKFSNSFELFAFLHSLNLLCKSPSWWWPDCGEFEVIIGAILTQNTQWENVQKSFQNLYNAQVIAPHQNQENLISIAQINLPFFASLIAPSGFATKKSQRLQQIAQNILHCFGDYQSFVQKVDQDWLIAQKGIGQESRDAILNYACKREIMVVDKYTHRLLCQSGYEMHQYQEIQEWLMRGATSQS